MNISGRSRVLKSKEKIHTPDFHTSQAKLPPQSTDLEMAILGALMIEKEAVNQVIDLLTPDHFYNDFHKMIYQAITILFNKSYPIDMLTVSNQLEENGHLKIIGGRKYLADLTINVNSSSNIEFHARIIIENFIRREIIRYCHHYSTDAFNPTIDVFETLDQLENSIYEVTDKNISRKTTELSSIVRQSINEITNKNKNLLSGIPTGFTAIDKLTNGWQKTDLIIIAARPGMGKTSFILSAARNASVDFDKPVAIFSLEMSNIQLVNRLISSEAEISTSKLKTGNLNQQDNERLLTYTNKLMDTPIFIDDTPSLTILELRAKARRLKSQKNIQLLIVDYLQLMTSNKTFDNREQEISSISRSLKALAKELNIPVIALSQLNRSVETRSDKRPMLSDLRESGAIEQDADMVLFLYRPAYYGSDQEYCDHDDCEVIFSKNRNGALDTIQLSFVPEYTKFLNKY